MAEYVKVDGNGELVGNTIYNPVSIANELGINYFDGMPIPSNFEPIEEQSSSTPLTKYQMIEGDTIIKQNDKWVRQHNIVDGVESRIDFVDNVISKDARIYRNTLLTNSDWTQLPDAQLTSEKKVEWTIYRQALRDITTDPAWPVYHRMPSAPQ